MIDIRCYMAQGLGFRGLLKLPVGKWQGGFASRLALASQR